MRSVPRRTKAGLAASLLVGAMLAGGVAQPAAAQDTCINYQDENGEWHSSCDDYPAFVRFLIGSAQAFCDEYCNTRGIRCLVTGDPQYCGNPD